MESQFHYWAEDEIACNFRKMLTLEQYRNSEMFDSEQAAELTKEECTALIKVLELKNQLTDTEQQSIYFRGCYGGVGYLKKARIL